jgi:ubiquinone/menaquinone biosynthesis C-methylase UbiE
MGNKARSNFERNKDHYEKVYSNYRVENILYWLKNIDSFLSSATQTETSWYSLYQNNFQNNLRGKKVLEMGCGDCVNAAMMAGLGAEVYANDIADSSGIIIQKINESYQFDHPIKFVAGDFLKNELESNQFDYVIGKAFLHHLTLAEESLFLKETARLLKESGEARFFEPAVNSVFLDELRWMVPVKGRPSKLNREAFRKWKDSDPHPDRSFSSRHFKSAGKNFFEQVKIIPVGSIERFSRFYRWGTKQNNYKKWALKAEKKLPYSINQIFARSQLVIYKEPIKTKS